jgi:hypothetical protein
MGLDNIMIRNFLYIVLFGFFMTIPALYAWADDDRRYTYNEFDMQALAELYWAVDRQDIDDNEHVDNFLRITQCSLFTGYFQNEFEWQEIREAAKQYLKQNKKTFARRYQYTQPIKLGDYNIKDKTFEIQEDYKLKGIRRFEVIVSTVGRDVCGIVNNIPGYPRSIAVGFSRPIALTNIAVDKNTALEYIANIQEEFKKAPKSAQTRTKLFQMRHAYIVMKIRFFSSQGDARDSNGGFIPLLLGILEGIEIYADPEKTKLLMKKDMIRRRKKTTNAGLPGSMIPNDLENNATQKATMP